MQGWAHWPLKKAVAARSVAFGMILTPEAKLLQHAASDSAHASPALEAGAGAGAEGGFLCDSLVA